MTHVELHTSHSTLAIEYAYIRTPIVVPKAFFLALLTPYTVHLLLLMMASFRI